MKFPVAAVLATLAVSIAAIPVDGPMPDVQAFNKIYRREEAAQNQEQQQNTSEFTAEANSQAQANVAAHKDQKNDRMGQAYSVYDSYCNEGYCQYCHYPTYQCPYSGGGLHRYNYNYRNKRPFYDPSRRYNQWNGRNYPQCQYDRLGTPTSCVA